MSIMREKDPHTPGVYIEEVPSGARPIQRVGTRTAGFVGVAPNPDAPLNKAIPINNWSEFRSFFVTCEKPTKNEWTNLAYAVYGFFINGGSRCYVVNVGERNGASNPIVDSANEENGLGALARIDEISMVAAPGYTDYDSYTALYEHCQILGDRVAILDGPKFDDDPLKIKQLIDLLGAGNPDSKAEWKRPAESKSGETTIYMPWIGVRNPLWKPPGTNGKNQAAVEQTTWVPPSGHIAGVWARTDALRGVHKAPANEVVHGAVDLQYHFMHTEQGKLNDCGVNCIREFREGILVWGARTTNTANWKYLNVRRLFNLIEESISESTRWIVFEPNDRTLWNAIRRDVTAFLLTFWREGALMGATPEQAFYVKCDEETNPPESIDLGRVVIEIGIAPVKPAEFVMFRVRQLEAGTEIEEAGGK